MEPKKSRKGLWAIAIALLVLALLILCGGIVSIVTDGAKDDASRAVQLVDPAATGVGSAPAVKAKSTPSPSPTPKLGLSKGDIRLTVKTTDKSCFGSAGCNVEYEIRASISAGVTPGECDVTYEVRGLEDAQIGTLHVTPDGRYTQDSWQSGQTPRSSSKLTAVVTEIECE
jgi:hypothetical protein